ncbi:MAG: DMT family transporter, partial [Muribaculum sp.]|nr:DMT family transporter [Muribaculaceae bacterium]MCM1081608.1 DMT family transporter [Muribaculum sp.]
MSQSIKGHLSMAGANIMWGLMSPIAKVAMASTIVSPILLVDMRVAGGAILFWITSLFCKCEKVAALDLLLLAGASMLGILFNQSCFIIGLSYTSPGEGSLITTTMPMWVMILAWLILKEPITLKKASGIALGATGALILRAHIIKFQGRWGGSGRV